MSTFSPPLKLCLISGNSTVASVHPVTVDESDTGPTAANYDAYQHLHTHTHKTHKGALTARNNVYTQHGHAKWKQVTHFPVLYPQTQILLQRNYWLEYLFHYRHSALSSSRLHYIILFCKGSIWVWQVFSFSFFFASAEIRVLMGCLKIICDRFQSINIWFLMICLIYMHYMFSESFFFSGKKSQDKMWCTLHCCLVSMSSDKPSFNIIINCQGIHISAMTKIFHALDLV